MKAFDFSYGDKNLSDFGFILCNFGGSKGLETVSDGCQIAFNTVPVLGGSKHHLISTEYEECLEDTWQICKHSCNGGVQEITESEHREITKWLNRKRFLKLKILDESHIDIYYEAVFNISKIKIDGMLFGFELEVRTNAPFAFKESRIINIKNTVKDGKYSINDTSYEEGYIYPKTEITISKDGNLNIYNSIEDRNTYIANCKKGEIITMDYPVIQSSISSHNIQNDFNWNFFRVANTYENSRNDLTISLPCSIKLEYSPIVKVGL
jgi:hypothetical protein